MDNFWAPIIGISCHLPTRPLKLEVEMLLSSNWLGFTELPMLMSIVEMRAHCFTYLKFFGTDVDIEALAEDV